MRLQRVRRLGGFLPLSFSSLLHQFYFLYPLEFSDFFWGLAVEVVAYPVEDIIITEVVEDSLEVAVVDGAEAAEGSPAAARQGVGNENHA